MEDWSLHKYSLLEVKIENITLFLYQMQRHA